ncbi:MAG: DUF4190 domain-containing protein [Micropruina sp.]|uniref:DUF4190 domain-containing protein n=1 Tax=Micropruina sp. TaxID=2737536 RepID=UPI0039E3902F
MRNQQYSPWSQPNDPTEPTGWSPPQQFGTPASQPHYLSPDTAYAFDQRMPYHEPAEHPNAISALVLGVLGIVTLFVAFPFLSPVAWYLGAKARRDMRLQPGRYRRSGALTTGYVLGIIGTLIALVFITIIVIGVALFAFFR